MSPVSNANITAFVRNGITIKEPKDFVGKKVGAPGPRRVPARAVREMAGRQRCRSQEGQFRRSDLPDHAGHHQVRRCRCRADRRAASVIAHAGGRSGQQSARATRRSSSAPEPIIFYAASREWAEKNPTPIRKFRAAHRRRCGDRATATRTRPRPQLRNSPNRPSNWSRRRRRTSRTGAEARATGMVDRRHVARRKCWRPNSISTD